MGEKGEGSGGERGGNWGERGRELGMGYPPVHPLSLDMLLSNKRITKVLIRLRGCAGWFAPLFFANPR